MPNTVKITLKSLVIKTDFKIYTNKQINDEKIVMAEETEKIEKQDLRVIKTHRIIHGAFVELLHEKAYEQITVQEIIDRALVNRNTFYKYYSGKSALAEKMVAGLRADYIAFLQQRFSGEIDLHTLMLSASHFFEQRKLLLALWKIQTKRHHLYADMFALIKSHYLKSVQTKLPETQAAEWDYQAEMFANLMMASLRYYFERDLPLPVKQLLKKWREMIALAERDIIEKQNPQ